MTEAGGRGVELDDTGPPGFDFNLSLGLVAGNSPVTRVVVSRILNRSGLQAIVETPAEAVRHLLENRPCVVVADGGPSNEDCAALVEGVAGLRRAAGTGLPVLVLLTTAITEPRHVDPGGTVSAVVAKPITPEALQPVVEILLEPFRG